MNQSKYHLTLSLIGILVLSWWLHAQVLSSNFEESTIIQGTSLFHVTDDKLLPSNYALRGDAGR
ncbi:MAG: hypothetical protein ACI9FR_001649 [Cryomorphaceae bacterium]|jgi:hypothetical protein